MKKKLVSGLLVMAMLTSMFTTVTVSAEEEITLSFMHSWTESDAKHEIVSGRIGAYTEANPNVNLEVEVLNGADLATKIQTLAAANELPDIFMLKGQMAKSFVENGYVMDLTDFLASNEEWANGFRDGVFSNFEIQGGTYAVPTEITNTFVYYNTEMFAEAGIEEFPTTWDGLMETCQKLLDAGMTPIVLGNAPMWTAESVIMSTLGNRCTGNEWYESIRNNTGAAWTDPEFVLALQKLYDLAEIGAFNSDVNSIDNDAQKTVFMNGGAAMMFEGSWAVGTLELNMEQEAKEKVGLAIMPSIEGGKGDQQAVTGGSGWGIAVNANLDESKKEAVYEFIKTFIGTEFSTKCAELGMVSAYVPGEYELPADSVLAVKYGELIKDRPFVPVYDHQLSSGMMDVMQSGLQEILNNSKTAEVLAEELQAEHERENN